MPKIQRTKAAVNESGNIQSIIANNGGAHAMRPFIDKKGKARIVVNVGTVENPRYETRLVGNAALRYDEWRRLDDAVVRVARNRLVGFDDLRRNGLVYPLGNALGTTVLTWEMVSDAMEAQVSMDPVKRTKNDQVDYKAAHLPIPVFHSDYQIGERLLQESRNRGNGLDTMGAEAATRRVLEKLEDSLFGTQSLMQYGGGYMYTYLNHPDVNELPFDSAGQYWDDVNVTGPDIKDDVVEMKQALLDSGHYGPYMMYISSNYETKMDDDYRNDESANSTQTIRERLLRIEGIQAIRVVDRLPADTVLLVEMSTETVDLVDGMPLTNIEWESTKFMHDYKVMAIQVPRVKSDYNGKCGIVVKSTQSYK